MGGPDGVGGVEAETTGEMHDPSDLVTAADLPERIGVGDVGLLDEQPGALVGRDHPVRAGRAALHQDAGLTQVEQRPGDM